MAFLGVDVDGLKNIATRCTSGATVADGVRAALEALVAASWATDAFGAAFIAYLKSVIAWLKKVAETLRAFAAILSINANKQQQVSNGSTTPTVPSTPVTPLPTPVTPPATTPPVVTPPTPAPPAVTSPPPAPPPRAAAPSTVAPSTPRATSPTPSTIDANGRLASAPAGVVPQAEPVEQQVPSVDPAPVGGTSVSGDASVGPAGFGGRENDPPRDVITLADETGNGVWTAAAALGAGVLAAGGATLFQRGAAAGSEEESSTEEQSEAPANQQAR